MTTSHSYPTGTKRAFPEAKLQSTRFRATPVAIVIPSHQGDGVGIDHLKGAIVLVPATFQLVIIDSIHCMHARESLPPPESGSTFPTEATAGIMTYGGYIASMANSAQGETADQNVILETGTAYVTWTQFSDDGLWTVCEWQIEELGTPG